jgi:hypothetical protein
MQNQFFLAVFGTGMSSKVSTSTRLVLFDNTNYNFHGFPWPNLWLKNLDLSSANLTRLPCLVNLPPGAGYISWMHRAVAYARLYCSTRSVAHYTTVVLAHYASSIYIAAVRTHSIGPYTFHKNTKKTLCVRTKRVRARVLNAKKSPKALGLHAKKPPV